MVYIPTSPSYPRPPCPSGTLWNTQSLNGTLFLVCLPITPEQQAELNANTTNLILGIVFGILIPIPTFMFVYDWILRRRWKAEAAAKEAEEEARKEAHKRMFLVPVRTSIHPTAPESAV